MPLAEIGHRLAELPRDKHIVAYCRGPFCFFSEDVCQLLNAHGYRAAYRVRAAGVAWGGNSPAPEPGDDSVAGNGEFTRNIEQCLHQTSGDYDFEPPAALPQQAEFTSGPVAVTGIVS